MVQEKPPEVRGGFPGNGYESPSSGEIPTSFPDQDAVSLQQPPQLPLFPGQGEGRPIRLVEESRQIFRPIVVGVPTVKALDLRVRGQTSPEPFLFDEKRQPLQVGVLDLVIRKSKIRVPGNMSHEYRE